MSTGIHLTCDEVLDEFALISFSTFKQTSDCCGLLLGWTRVLCGQNWWENCKEKNKFHVSSTDKHTLTSQNTEIIKINSSGESFVLYLHGWSNETSPCVKSRRSVTVLLSSFSSLLRRTHSCSLASSSSCSTFPHKHFGFDAYSQLSRRLKKKLLSRLCHKQPVLLCWLELSQARNKCWKMRKKVGRCEMTALKTWYLLLCSRGRNRDCLTELAPQRLHLILLLTMLTT